MPTTAAGVQRGFVDGSSFAILRGAGDSDLGIQMEKITNRMLFCCCGGPILIKVNHSGGFMLLSKLEVSAL